MKIKIYSGDLASFKILLLYKFIFWISFYSSFYSSSAILLKPLKYSLICCSKIRATIEKISVRQRSGIQLIYQLDGQHLLNNRYLNLTLVESVLSEIGFDRIFYLRPIWNVNLANVKKKKKESNCFLHHFLAS